MKVKNIPNFFSRMKYLVIFVACIECVIAKSNHANINVFDFEQIKNDLFSNVPNLISENGSPNWTESHNCLSELNAIKNGLNNLEEWAVKSRSNLNFIIIFVLNHFRF